jgi:hypothetical protein
VDTLSATSVWAVGSSHATGATLIEHFNGSKWSIESSPNRSGSTELEDVAAISGKNVWAVGYFVPKGSGHPKTLTEHYDGSKWKVVASPSPHPDDVLFGVAALSASDVWAVGEDGNPGRKTLIEHWNGSKWIVVPGASLQNGGGLRDVTAIAKTNVIAVGHNGTVGTDHALVEQWDGATWSSVPTPATGQGTELYGVSARGPNAVWAAGVQSGSAAIQTLTERDVGSGWEVVPSPNPSGASHVNELWDVSALSSEAAWAVGDQENSGFVRRTTAMHYTNGSWQVTPSTNASNGSNRLFGVAATTSTKTWAVGTGALKVGSTGMIEKGC